MLLTEHANVVLLLRDFTIPGAYQAADQSAAGAVPAAPAATTAAAAAPAAPAAPAAAVDHTGAVVSSNVVQCGFESVSYAPTVEALHTLFSTYGQVQKIVISEHNSKYTVSGVLLLQSSQSYVGKVTFAVAAGRWVNIQQALGVNDF